MKQALPCFAAVLLSAGALAQTTNVDSRSLTLSESIRLAVENNLDLKIERYTPQLSLYQLEAAYGAYDPNFSFDGQHSYEQSGSRLIGGGFTIPGATSESDSFSSSLGGLLPLGTTYSLNANANDSYGNSFDIGGGSDLVTRPFENSGASIGASVRQPLLKNFWIDAPRLQIRVAKNRLKYSEQTLKLRVMGVVNQTEQMYYALIAAREFVNVQAKAVELATRLLAENRKRVEVGAMAPLDERQAESQAAASRADLITARNLVAIRENDLKQLITGAYLDWASTTIVPLQTLEAPRQFFSRQDSWTKGLQERPEMVQAKLDIERAGYQVKFSRNQLLPQVDLFGTYGYGGSGNEFSDSIKEAADASRPRYSYGGAISFPLANTEARSAYRQSKATQQQSALLLKRLEQQIMIEIDNAIKTAQSSFERVEATRAASEYAEAALQAEQKKLESGKSTSFNVLSLQRDLTTARNSEIAALVEYNRALAALAFAEGDSLRRHRIDFEVR